MRICKYCKKPISDNNVWNPDSEGNGYHHACLIEKESRARDRQIYDKGRADALDKLRDEIELIEINGHIRDVECYSAGINTVLKIIDRIEGSGEE